MAYVIRRFNAEEINLIYISYLINLIFFYLFNLIWIFIHKGSPIISILSQINTIPRIYIYFFKIYSNIFLSFTPRPS